MDQDGGGRLPSPGASQVWVKQEPRPAGIGAGAEGQSGAPMVERRPGGLPLGASRRPPPDGSYSSSRLPPPPRHGAMLGCPQVIGGRCCHGPVCVQGVGDVSLAQAVSDSPGEYVFPGHASGTVEPNDLTSVVGGYLLFVPRLLMSI